LRVEDEVKKEIDIQESKKLEPNIFFQSLGGKNLHGKDEKVKSNSPPANTLRQPSPQPSE
jgi:hypothetical protein